MPGKNRVKNVPELHAGHSNKHDVECILAIEASMSDEQFKGYLKGNTLKYLWRCDYKGKEEQDLKKGMWYYEKLIEKTLDITAE